MKNLKINIDFGRPEAKTDKEKADWLSNAELTADYINFAARSKYGEGLKGLNLRSFSRIQRKLDKAIDEGKDDISLEKGEFDLVKSLFTEDVGFPAQIAKYVVMIMDEIDALNKKEDTESEEDK